MTEDNVQVCLFPKIGLLQDKDRLFNHILLLLANKIPCGSAPGITGGENPKNKIGDWQKSIRDRLMPLHDGICAGRVYKIEIHQKVNRTKTLL